MDEASCETTADTPWSVVTSQQSVQVLPAWSIHTGAGDGLRGKQVQRSNNPDMSMHRGWRSSGIAQQDRRRRRDYNAMVNVATTEPFKCVQQLGDALPLPFDKECSFQPAMQHAQKSIRVPIQSKVDMIRDGNQLPASSILLRMNADRSSMYHVAEPPARLAQHVCRQGGFAPRILATASNKQPRRASGGSARRVLECNGVINRDIGLRARSARLNTRPAPPPPSIVLHRVAPSIPAPQKQRELTAPPPVDLAPHAPSYAWGLSSEKQRSSEVSSQDPSKELYLAELRAKKLRESQELMLQYRLAKYLTSGRIMDA